MFGNCIILIFFHILLIYGMVNVCVGIFADQKQVDLFLVSPVNMISRPKNGWHSILPLNFRGKAVTGFCIFPKVKSAGYSPENAPVYLNVYDLTNANGYVYWAGFGIFHSGVEG